MPEISRVKHFLILAFPPRYSIEELLIPIRNFIRPEPPPIVPLFLVVSELLPVDYLPLFAAIKEKPVLVVGGGEIAERKIAFLRRAGARVQVVAQRLEPQLQQLADSQAIHWLATEFDEAQLDAVFLVIAATDDTALNQRVFARR